MSIKNIQLIDKITILLTIKNNFKTKRITKESYKSIQHDKYS